MGGNRQSGIVNRKSLRAVASKLGPALTILDLRFPQLKHNHLLPGRLQLRIERSQIMLLQRLPLIHRRSQRLR